MDTITLPQIRDDDCCEENTYVFVLSRPDLLDGSRTLDYWLSKNCDSFHGVFHCFLLTKLNFQTVTSNAMIIDNNLYEKLKLCSWQQPEKHIRCHELRNWKCSEFILW